MGSPMPAITISDGSSALSEGRKGIVASRDGGLCVLCGLSPVDIAHIIARKSGDPTQIEWIRVVSPSLDLFRKDDSMNLICLCPTHHRQFDKGYFVLIPTEDKRRQLREYEIADFSNREQCIQSGFPDPGRSFPNISCEFEYVPVYAGRFFLFVHHPTPFDPTYFAFDSFGDTPCHPLHFQASFIALLLEAQPVLASATRVRTPKTDLAAAQVTELIELYRRIPYRPPMQSNLTRPISAVQLLHSLNQNTNTLPKSPMLPTIPGSPPLLPATQHHTSSFTVDSQVLNVPGLTPSSSTSTDTGSDTSGFDLAYSNADPQLLEYAKEPAMSWEDLKNRPPLVPGEQVEPRRFATAEDICRRWQ